ncbi:MAG TPA: Trm112 family protein [Chitinophagaceae bacterium]
MTPETIKKLCCSFDKTDLQLTIISQTIDGNIEEGYFVCNKCNRLYPIVKGIPIMSPDEYREFKLEQSLLNRWQQYLKGMTVENFRLVEQLSEDNK